MTEAPAAPAYLRRHGEFDPDPSAARLREQAGIARFSTPFGYEAWLVTLHADVRRVLSDSRRFSIVLPPDYSRRLADEDMSDEDACMESGTKWGRLRGERRLRVGSASMAAYAQMGQFCTLGGSGERPVTVGGTAASNHQGRG